ncbi:MAG: putative peptidoglycan-binding domain-containing protein [Bacteroidota bacterium]
MLACTAFNAINRCEPETLFNAIKAAWINYYRTIAKRGQNQKFLKGWLKRINLIEFGSSLYHVKKESYNESFLSSLQVFFDIEL